jgi:acetyltransferase-like isoleucine patch superfamily enzyme
MLKRLCRYIAHRHGRGIGLYLAVCQPSGDLHAMGEDCSIQTNVTISDPAYVTLGDNVRLSGCTLFGHDGVVNMLNRACGRKIDRVGRIRIGNHVFIGHDCVVMPDVTIGDCVVVATNSVVTSDLEGGFVYAGSPARPIGRVDQLVEKLQRDSDAYPWAPLIATRHGGFDAAMEPVLKQMRVAHFYQG